MKLKLRCFFYSTFVLVMLLSAQNNSFGQARIVIGTASAVYVRMSGGVQATPICLVLDNAATNAFTCGAAGAVCPTSGSPSWVISEGQYNYVVWRGITTTSYLVPVGTIAATNSYLPVTFNKTAGAADNLVVSTWTAASNNTPWAGISDDLLGAQVPAVGDMNINGSNASVGSVIDRWWDIDAATSTADVTFSYRGSENTMTVSPTGVLAAQHWTGTLWNDGKGGGTGTKTTTGQSGGQTAATVYSATAAGITQFTPFILITDVAPLPVTWLNVAAECNRGDVTVKWSTASEQNSDYFTVERSYDGTNFTDIANVLAAGQSSTVKNYSYIDEDPIAGLSYYRIRETDFNSSSMLSTQMIVNGCSNDDIFIYGSEGGVSININAIEEGEYNFELYDILGQKLMNEIKNVSPGSNHLKLSVSNIASAMYVVKVYSTNNVVSKKVFVRSAYTQ
jgi:hypothetical protein